MVHRREDWRVEEVALGSSTFEWLKGGDFVVLGGDNDHEPFHDATCVIGRAEPGEGLVVELQECDKHFSRRCAKE